MKRALFAVLVCFTLLSSGAVGLDVNNQNNDVSKRTTLYVGGMEPGNYSCIQDAIDNASSGDIILVFNGSYHENINVDKELIIQSVSQNPSDTIVSASNANEDVFYITSDNVSIRGFTINNENAALVIEESDCTDLHYIGTYASNGTIFDSSYEDPENNSGGDTLPVFVSLDENATAWKDGYTSVIQGLAEGLLGMKEGETKTVGPIPPEKAYGNFTKLAVGDTFFSKNLNLRKRINKTWELQFEVEQLDSQLLKLKWIGLDDLGSFTMPWLFLTDLTAGLYPPPGYLWENATSISSYDDENVTLRITPTSSENLTDEGFAMFINWQTETSFVFWNASSAEWDDETITITSDPQINDTYLVVPDYSLGASEGVDIPITVNSVSETHINVTMTYQGQTQAFSVNRSIQFPRSFEMTRFFDIPITMMDMPVADLILGEELENQGFSLNPLAGETLLFEVTVETIYKQNSPAIAGIYLNAVKHCNILNNNVSNNTYGINLDSSSNNTIVGNTILNNNEYGIRLDTLSTSNTIYHNNFVNNTANAIDDAYNTSWDNGRFGNYWDDYKTLYPDAHRMWLKGIWNQPYVISEGVQDNFPLIVPHRSPYLFIDYLLYLWDLITK